LKAFIEEDKITRTRTKFSTDEPYPCSAVKDKGEIPLKLDRPGTIYCQAAYAIHFRDFSTTLHFAQNDRALGMTEQ